MVELIQSFLRVGIGAFGGGLATIRLIYHEIVDIHGWLSATEMAEVVTLAEMTPGPIALNAATYTGFRVAGTPGAILATLAVLLPSLILLLLLVGFQRARATQGLVATLGELLRPGVVALVLAALVSMGRATVTSGLSALFAGLSFLVFLGTRKPHPAWVILLFGLLGMALL